MIKYFLSRQFFYFLIVGSIAALLHWVARIILNIWFSFGTSVFLAYHFGVLSAYILNANFVFPNSTKNITHQVKYFFAINIFFLPVVWMSSILFEHWLSVIGEIKFSREIAHGCAIFLPVAGTFIFYKFIAFGETK